MDGMYLQMLKKDEQILILTRQLREANSTIESLNYHSVSMGTRRHTRQTSKMSSFRES
jgi:hypothetical protein